MARCRRTSWPKRLVTLSLRILLLIILATAEAMLGEYVRRGLERWTDKKGRRRGCQCCWHETSEGFMGDILATLAGGLAGSWQRGLRAIGCGASGVFDWRRGSGRLFQEMQARSLSLSFRTQPQDPDKASRGGRMGKQKGTKTRWNA